METTYKQIIQNIVGKQSRSLLMGLAMVWVILHHYAIFSSEHAGVFTLFSKGYIGVDIFFFLSMYGCCHSYANNTLFTFYKNRIKRIYPMYFLYIALWIGFNEAFHLDHVNSYSSMFINSITSICVIGQCHSGVDMFEWYIPALMFLYAIFPLLYKLCEKLSKINTTAIIIILAFTFILSNKISLYFCEGISLRLPVILMGILLYFFEKEDKPSKYALVSFFTALSALFIPTKHVLDTSLLIPLLLLGFGLFCNKIKIAFDKVAACFSFIGKHSLEIYLAQGIATARYLKLLTHNNLIYAWGGVILITIIVAVLLYYFSKYFYKIWNYVTILCKK